VVVVTAVVLAGAGVSLATDGLVAREWRRWYYHRDRAALLADLQPVALSNCTLKRYGSAHDGGYLLCENLIAGLATAYSYGVGPNDDWGCEISRRYGVPVHQYDCFDPARPACDGGRFVFHNECIGPSSGTIDGRVFGTLAGQIAANGDTGRAMIVKIDVEGAEWGALLATPDAVLAGIDQLAMELHGVDDPQYVQVVRKLKRTFHLVNLHFNNATCTRESEPLPAWAYQVLLVNKRLGVLDTSVRPPAPSSPLNAPDVTVLPDCQLRAPRE
jgi:hypothetical protein